MENENEIKESIISEVEMENKSSSESAELVSDKNINNEQVREVENTTKEYFDIYSDTMTEMRDLVAMNSMKDTLRSTLDALNIKEENIKEAYNTFKLFNKEVETLNKNQIENLFNILGYSIDDVKDKDENEIFEFKKNLVELVISTEEGMRSFDEMSKETDNITETFKAEMDKILASLNMTEQLENLTKAINEEKDENKKKELYLIYTGIYSSLSLDNIIRAIDNKGYNQLVKESKKKYDKVYKDALKILQDDLYNVYNGIKGLDNVMYKLFPENKEAVRVLLYTIYRQIIKNTEVKIIDNKADQIKTNKTVKKQIATFINYFVLNVIKLTKESFKKEDSKLYQTIKEYLDSHSNK